MEVRIAGINIPIHKHAQIALTAVYGIGHTKATQICHDAAIKPDKKIKDLAEADIDSLRTQVEKYTIEGELRRQVAMNIKRKMDIGTYAGYRHRRGLPLKARTRTNAKTRKKRSRGRK